MRTTESCSTLTTININILSEYAEKKNMIYAQHQIMIIRHVASEKC